MQEKAEILKTLKSLIKVDSIIKVVLSNPIKKAENLPKKIIIRKFNSKGLEFFQFEYFIENKVIHKNKEQNLVNLEVILNLLEQNFKQCNIFSTNCNLTILKNKANLFKITSVEKIKSTKENNLTHNKNKSYILKDFEKLDWLEKLGVIDKNGKILKNKEKKFKQINKFLETLETVEKYLKNGATIVDIGCGKSYLTFAMYYYFNNIKMKNVKIKGFDLKKDVVQNCNEIAKSLNYENLEFFCEDVSNLKSDGKQIDMLISLHACDIATDYALYYGAKYNCKIIMSVPCCQHELFDQVKNDDLSILLNYGILKEKFTSLLTDALRAKALKLIGYKVDVIEFIDMEHTPKNIMIKAVKKDKYFGINKEELEKYENLIKKFNVYPKIYHLFKQFFYKN